MTKFCPNCGKKLDAAAKFCPYCGQNLTHKKETSQSSISLPIRSSSLEHITQKNGGFY